MSPIILFISTFKVTLITTGFIYLFMCVKDINTKCSNINTDTDTNTDIKTDTDINTIQTSVQSKVY